jgi:lycopene cyclase domain-containing protein
MYYLISLCILVAISLALHVVFKEKLFVSMKERMLWVGIALVVGIAWDIYAIPRQHWIFPDEKGILGIYFIKGIPIEELLWFLIVPYFFLIVYKTIHVILDKK